MAVELSCGHVIDLAWCPECTAHRDQLLQWRPVQTAPGHFADEVQDGNAWLVLFRDGTMDVMRYRSFSGRWCSDFKIDYQERWTIETPEFYMPRPRTPAELSERLRRQELGRE